MKTWQKAGLISLGAIGIIYYQRQRIRRGYNYAKDKFAEYMGTFASEWIGVKEIGNNQSFGNTVFQQMLKNVGWRSSEEWCMYFAKAVHYEAYKNDRQEINRVLSGSTQRSFESLKKNTSGIYEVVESGEPRNGDIAIWQWTKSPSKGHAGVVLKVNKDGTMETIEGNTGGKSISNGDTVAKKIRPSTIGKYIPGSTLRLRGFIRKKIFNEKEKTNIGLLLGGLGLIGVGVYIYIKKAK